MNRLQEGTGRNISKPAETVNRPDEYLELTQQNTDKQMRSALQEEAAYAAFDTIERHKTFQHKQRSYNEVQEQYTEQAFSASSVQVPSLDQTQESFANVEQEHVVDVSVSSLSPVNITATEWKSPAVRGLEAGKGMSGDQAAGGTVFGNGLDTGDSFGTAEASELWKNTDALQKNEELLNKLEGRRGDVQRGYTRLALGRHSTKGKVSFNYYGRFNISGEEKELLHLGRLKFYGQVAQEKMTKKDYEDILKEKEKKQFKRRMKGRLAFRGAKAVVEEETLAEDEMFGTAKRYIKRGRRIASMGVRRSIRTLKLQNNTYYRLELAKEKQIVLQDKRDRLMSEEKRRQQKEALKSARSKEQKKKLKKQMVQQRAMEQGNFIIRSRQNRLVKKRAKKLRQKAVKKTLATVFSTAVLILFFIILFFILFLVMVAIFTGGAHYYSSAVTQNDYSTITDATEYFRKLETDLDEYLNADREALEAKLEAEYGPDLYEFIYDLADFGFSANTLIAYLSAKYGSFTQEEIEGELESIFEEMYTLTIEVKEEEREIQDVMERKKICYVTLEKKELEEVVEARLQDDQRFNYDAYRLSTGGQQVYCPVMREDWTNKISSNFGDRVHPITKKRKPHNGVDIAVPTGTHLYSAVDGTVILARYSESAGNWVKVRTESGWTIVMMHMDSLTVSEGQTVKRGDHLGYSGNTGNSTGPHLHLEVRDPNDKAINPIFIIPQTSAGAGKEEAEK